MKLPHRNKALFLIWIMLVQLFAPVPGLALSGGNKAPEFESFQPFGLDNMVDLATGDFSYNIPLMNVGFHGINLSYQAGITMDQEATMVGLGWNINSGMINRTMRGIPDDFKGDIITKTQHTKDYTTVGFQPGVNLEGFGFDAFGLGVSLGVYKNSYNGVGFEFSISPNVSASLWGDAELTSGFGLSASSDGGATLSPNISFKVKNKLDSGKTKSTGFSIGTSINSRGGLKALSLGASIGLTEGKRTISKASRSSSVSFAKPSFIPYMDFPAQNIGFTINGALGGAVSGAFAEATASGYFSKQSTLNEQISVNAYGLKYAEFSTANALKDFHRAKDIPQSEDIPNLAVPILDFDIYSVSGPGISGTMQLKRGDMGVVFDRISNTVSADGSLGAELGLGTYSHLGADAVANKTTQSTRLWNQNNVLSNSMSFKSLVANNKNFEPSYFKMSSESSIELPSNNDALTQMKEMDPIQPKLFPAGPLNYSIDGRVKSSTDPNTNHSLGSISGTRHERDKRSNQINYVTFEEAIEFGFSSYISTNSGESNFESLINSGYAKDHHIAEIIVENADGYKYVYGLPIYNIQHLEETFAIEVSTSPNTTGLEATKNTGLVNYNNQDASVANDNGIDNLYSSTEIPPYVSTYALTAILSSDYQDLSGNGPTTDDYGNYVKFDYEKVNNYNWKTPTSQKDPATGEPLTQASLSIGFISNGSSDNKANIVKGTRQQYRPKSISDKSEIAIYDYYSNRLDSKGVLNDPINPQSDIPIPPLKNITKYSYHDYKSNPNQAIKLKSVHFEYDYTLCDNIYNGDQGKLTLKKLYVLNGESTKGRFSPYTFEYSDLNPNYNPKAVNRFGGFQPRNIGAASDGYVSIPSLSNFPLTTTDFPYIPQESRSLQDEFASAWNLTKIGLPSGASIEVEYEADDYAHVQDKRAMQMFKILGMSSSSLPNTSGSLVGKNFIHFDIFNEGGFNQIENDPLLSASQKAIKKDQLFEELYIKDLAVKPIYFKVFGNLDDGSINVNEFVPGWVNIKSFGFNESSSGDYTGYVELEQVCLKDRRKDNCDISINPIQKTLMQALRLNLPGYLYGTDTPQSDQDENQVLEAVMALASTVTQLGQFVQGVNRWMLDRNYAESIVPSMSFIRLYNPTLQKISGTHRVSKIVMSDEFSAMTNSQNKTAYYGKQYEYNKAVNIAGVEMDVSSGVTAYEPAVGGDENPFFKAISFKEELLLAPDNTKYMEEPMMEDYYPGPQIIYDKVTVRDLYHPTGIIGTQGLMAEMEVYENTGFTESHHYTYKDFPIQEYQTDKIYGDPYKSPKVIELLKLKSKDFFTATQGYVILNPMMHGKSKANYTYNSAGQRISGQETFYKTDQNGRLDYNIDGLIAEGNNLKLKDARMGLEYHCFLDVREQETHVETMGATLNTDIIPALGIPAPIPMVLPKYADVTKRFRSAVIVKAFRQNGIVSKTVAINGPSEITTEHLAWDVETGVPLISRTYNEFNDPIYQVSLPAHLSYGEMGLSYQNSLAVYSGVNADNGNCNHTQLVNDSTEGDKLAIYNEDSFIGFAWVLNKIGSVIYLIDQDGEPVHLNNNQIKIIESGYSNQGSSNVGSYVTLKNPIDITTNTVTIDQSKKIIDASATTFRDQWQTFCGETDQKIDRPTSIGELVINGDFEQGNVGFTSEYNYQDSEDGNLTYGEYTFATNTIEAHTQWTPCEDINEGGQMMIIDGSKREPILDLWCQQLSVEPNSFYDINLDAINVNASSSPILQFYIDSEEIAEPITIDTESASSCDWRNYYKYWYSGESTSIEFCIKDLNTVGAGNDFAIDNISFVYSPTLNSRDCFVSEGEIVNPYLKNIRGNWLPEKSYVFQTDRIEEHNIREDGYYSVNNQNYNTPFTNFWNVQNSGLIPNEGLWTWTNQNTMVSPYGMELEAKDPLGRYSAELTGYNNLKVTAVAANAQYNEIAYYGAEIPLDQNKDVYGLSINQVRKDESTCRSPFHLKTQDGERTHYKSELPNSGEYSLKYTSGSNSIATFDIRASINEESCEQESDRQPYKVQKCDCIPLFEPYQNKRYYMSAWLKNDCLKSETCQETPYLNLNFGGQSIKIVTYGPLIEGWRKVEGDFEIPNGVSVGNLTIDGFQGSIFLDDLRIHPYHASMKTYNYDLNTLRFTFEHDDNNFFTRYDYADDGTLQRISKQTERGIQTLQESSFSQKKEY